MSISALAITLSSDESLSRAAIEALGRRPEVEVGPQCGRRVALTADTTSAAADRMLWQWISDLRGVEHADVVSVWFDDAPVPADPAGEDAA